MNGLGSGIMEIVMALLGIALIALLINKSQQTSQLVTTSASALNGLLQTVTLSGGMSIPSYSM